MFSDLVGSTALSARMDPEDLREVISAYQKFAAETVRRFGGLLRNTWATTSSFISAIRKPMRAMPSGLYALGWSWSRRWLRSRPLCLYRPVSALRLGWLSSAKVAGSEAENVIKIREPSQM
jgi:class 3 adenylate cyclase